MCMNIVYVVEVIIANIEYFHIRAINFGMLRRVFAIQYNHRLLRNMPDITLTYMPI